MSTAVVTGGCRCGAVRWEASALPVATRTCWCRDCQYTGAGTAVVNVFFAAEAVTVTGPLKIYVTPADSGAHIERGFCTECGTPVTSGATERPHLISFRAGTLDETGRFGPEATIWTASAPDWAQIDPAIPAHPGQIPPAR